MKKTYPCYIANRNNPITEKVFNSLSNKNQKAILNFMEICSIKSKSKKREFSRKTALIKFLDFLEKDFDKITYQDYISTSKAISESNLGVYARNGDRDFIKRFLRENYPNWREKFKELKLLSSEIKSEDTKITPKDLFSGSEVKKLMQVTQNMQHKTLIGVLYETASRPEEILKLRWSDIDLKKNIIYLFSAKTKKKRGVPIKESVPHLRRLQEESETKEDDFVFSSRDKKLTNSGLNYILKRLVEKAGIKKKVNSYIFRHSRLSQLITCLSPKVYEDVAGHSLQMGMKTYAHLSEDKIIKEMNEKVFKIEELSEDEKSELTKRIKLMEENMKLQEKISMAQNRLLIKTTLQNKDLTPKERKDFEMLQGRLK